MENQAKDVTAKLENYKKIVEQIKNNVGKNEVVDKIVPYKKIPVKMEVGGDEIGIMLENVIGCFKEESKKEIFELYNEDGSMIGKTDDSHRMIYDRDLLEDKIAEQIKAIAEFKGMSADQNIIDDFSRIESYYETLGRNLVILDKEQHEELEMAENRKEKNKVLKDAKERNADVEEDKEVKDLADNEMAKAHLQKDLDFKISKVTSIDDDLFYENVPGIKSGKAYAVLSDTGEAQIVTEKNGKYEVCDAFEKGDSEAGRADIARNDDIDLQTKNTYGSVKAKNSDFRYTLELGTYGEIKLLEQRPYKGSKIEEVDKYVTREVETANTNISDRNLEGHTVNNITERTFNRNSTNKDANYYGDSSARGGYGNKKDQIKNDSMEHLGNLDISMEGLAQDDVNKIVKVQNEIFGRLRNDGVTLNSDQAEKISNYIQGKIKTGEQSFCKEEVEAFCEKYEERIGTLEQNNKGNQEHQNEQFENVMEDKEENQESENQQSNEAQGRSRLEEYLENRRRRTNN